MSFLPPNKQKTIAQAAYFGHLYMLTKPKLQMPLLTNSAFLLNTDTGEGTRRQHVAEHCGYSPAVHSWTGRVSADHLTLVSLSSIWDRIPGPGSENQF